MANNYNNNGQDWYNQRLNTISNMMSMQKADPSYLAGALISQYFLRPQIQEYMQNKWGEDPNKSVANTSNANSNAITSMSNDQLKEVMQPQYTMDTDNALTSLALDKLAKPQTQAETNENNNNIINKAVTQQAQQQNIGAMGNVLNDLVPDNSNAITSRLAGQQQMVQQAANEEEAKRQQQAQLLMKAINSSFGGVSPFDKAVSPDIGEMATSPYKGKSMEQMIYQTIIDAKKDWQIANEKDDAEGMKKAEQSAQAARSLAEVNGIKLDVAGQNNSIEDMQNRLSKIKDYEVADDEIRNQLLNNILKTKQDYAIAQKDNNQAGMNDANTEANVIRRMAKEAGIDVSEGDSDVSIDNLIKMMNEEQQHQQQLQKEKEENRLYNLSPQELLKTPEASISPNEFYQRAYKDAINKRIPEYMARQIASDRASEYESRYMNILQSMMGSLGVNQDGSINNLGEAYLSRAIAANNPEFAQLYMNQFASPRDNYAYNQALQKAAIQQKYNQDNINLKSAQAMALSDRKFGQSLKLKQFENELDRRSKEYLMKVGVETDGMKEAQKYNIRNRAINELKARGYNITPEQEMAYIATGGFGGGEGGSSGSSPKNEKAPAWSRPLASGYDKAKQSLDGEDIDNFKNEVAKYAPEMDEEDRTYANSMILALEFLREKEAGNENMAAEYFAGIPDYYRKVLLPGY